MSVPAVALPAVAAGGVCLNSRHVGSLCSSDYDQNARLFSCSSAAGPSSGACGRKPVMGGLSCLFSSAHLLSSAGPSNDEPSSPWLDRSDELASSFSYSHSSSSIKCREQSPVTVFRSLVSCSSRSPPTLRTPRELNRIADFRLGRDKLLNGFIGYALGSFLDYDSHRYPVSGVDTANVEDILEKLGTSAEPYANDLLVGAQSRHDIFNEEFVVKAFYVSEKAHRGQVC